MDELIIDEHALVHGLKVEDIEQAWENPIASQHRESPNEHVVVVIGYDGKGRFIEIIAAQYGFGTVVFHALTPPTERIMKELGMAWR